MYPTLTTQYPIHVHIKLFIDGLEKGFNNMSKREEIVVSFYTFIII